MGIFDFLFGKKEDENKTKVFSKHELKNLLTGGQKIEAIKMVRMFSGEGLKEAKDFVDYFDSTGHSWEEVKKKFPSIAHSLEDSSDGTLCDDNDGPEKNSYFSEKRRKEIDEYLKAGQKITAIKLFREMSGTGLKNAKDFIDYLTEVNLSWKPAMEKFNYLFEGSSVSPECETDEIQEVNIVWAKLSQVYQKKFSYKDRKNIEELIKNNRNIEAIKEVRVITGLGLKEAKELVEELAQEIR